MVERAGGIWAAGLAIAVILLLVATSAASAETRSLKLHFTHTNERAEITFKRNGRFIREGLDQINWLLRDWRRNEKTEMDPRLMDLLWEVYKASGSRGYIHVISAYRSSATNQMLRSRSSGVADNSQHTRGRAIDFFLPDVPVQRLRDLGLQRHGGGVGFYPRSGSPFVHLDTGSVRHWPRMNRQQLMAVFPNGGTMHVPSDGKPLPGYQQAVAAYEARQRGAPSVQIASAGASSSSASGNGQGLLAALFGGGSSSSSNQQAAPAQAAPAAASTATATASARPTSPAPVNQAAPEPATPQTILAALPPSRVPLPISAPRPSIPVGGEVEVAVAAEPESIPFQLRDEAEIQAELQARQEPVEVAVNVPLPLARPDRLRASLEADGPAVSRAGSGEMQVAALASEPRAASGSGAIEGLLSSNDAAGVVVANMPVPELRPDRAQLVTASAKFDGAAERGEMLVLASLPEPETGLAAYSNAGRADLADAAAAKERAVASIGDSRLAPISAAASPRTAILERETGTDVVAALDSGVRTTAKSARPGPQHARPDRRPKILPVEDEGAGWVFAASSVSLVTDGTRAPSFARSAMRSAPRTVYTAGFQQQASVDNAYRFSGQAVQFMSVARFGTN